MAAGAWAQQPPPQPDERSVYSLDPEPLVLLDTEPIPLEHRGTRVDSSVAQLGHGDAVREDHLPGQRGQGPGAGGSQVRVAAQGSHGGSRIPGVHGWHCRSGRRDRAPGPGRVGSHGVHAGGQPGSIHVGNPPEHGKGGEGRVRHPAPLRARFQAAADLVRISRGAGVRDGDVGFYRIHADSLRTVFADGDGEVFLDQVDFDPPARYMVLGSYFARGSDFREKLVKSLLEQWHRRERTQSTPKGSR